MPADLRNPDYPERPLGDAKRGTRLREFVSQELSQYRDKICLIAWNPKTETWGAWFDDMPQPPPPKPLPAYPDPLKQADIHIGPR
jgi:hypothetical protein